MCPKIQNASQVKLSSSFQTDFDTPNYAGHTLLSSRNANPSPGNVEFQSSGSVGETTPVDVSAVSTTVEKTLTFNNMPKQLNALAKWALGEPISENPAPSHLISIGYRGLSTAKLTAAADKLTFETTSEAGASSFEIALPATIAGVISAINAKDGWFANPVYGSASTNWSWVGVMDLQAVSLVPASNTLSTKAMLRMYSPLTNCPEYLTLLYKLFATGTPVYAADIGAQATAFNIAMPRGGHSTIEIPYIAKSNIEVDSALITSPPSDMDRTGQYRSNPGLYKIFLAGQSFAEITEVSSTLTLVNNPEKSWDTTQLPTGVTKFEYQQQLNGFLSASLYELILQTYRTTDEKKSYLPSLISILHPQYADTANAIPNMFGYLVPKAKISQAPDLNVEEGALIPCNFAMQAIVPKGEAALYFFVIS